MAKKTINIRAGFDLKAFSSSQQNLVRQLQASGRKMQSIGKSMSMSLTAPIVGLGAVATKTFATFEQSMAKVKAISGATGSAFKDLEGTARQLGMTTRFSASEVAELMLNYSKLGFSASEIEKITGATLNLALATGEDLAQSASIAGGTLRGFALEADQMTRVTDVMAKSFSSSALDLEKFQNAMPKVSAVASSLGITLEETTAMLGVLANKNIRATTAGTGLKNIFLMTRKSGMSFNDAMDKINQSIDPTTTAMNMFGKENATVAVALAQSGDAISQMTAKLEDAGGSAEAMAKIMDDTLEGSMFRLQSAVSEMGISIGEKLAPHIIKVTNFLAKLAEGFSQLNPETQQIIIQLAATAAAIGPLIYAFGALKLAMAFLIAHPAVLVAIALSSALAALNIAASESGEVFGSVKDATDELGESYEKLRTQLDKVNQLKKKGSKASVEEIKISIETSKAIIEQTNARIKERQELQKKLILQKKEALQQALAAGRGKQGAMQGEFQGVELAGVANIEKQIKTLSDELIKVNNENVDLYDNTKQLEQILKRVENVNPTEETNKDLTTTTTKVETLIEKFKRLEQEFGTIASLDPLQSLKLGEVTPPTEAMEKMMKDLPPLTLKVKVEPIPLDEDDEAFLQTEKMKRIGGKMGEALSSGLETLVSNSAVMLGDFIGDAMSGDADAQDFGKGLLNVVGGFLQQMGAAMIGFGISFEAFKKSIETLNPALAIAGGIALVAAGTAISNLSKKGLDGGGGGTASSPSMAGGGMGGMNTQPIALETKISGRDLILVQNREKGFTR
jgi:tetrahydromethanopterin S-methyltransferase subunit B